MSLGCGHQLFVTPGNGRLKSDELRRLFYGRGPHEADSGFFLRRTLHFQQRRQFFRLTPAWALAHINRDRHRKYLPFLVRLSRRGRSRKRGLWWKRQRR